MIEMSFFFSEEDLSKLFEAWASEAEEYAAKKDRFDEYMRRLKQAKIPFGKKQEELLKQKRKKDKNAHLTVEEREEIWVSFWKVCRKIKNEIYGE